MTAPGFMLREMLRSGISIPWTLAASTAIGIALMCSRLIVDTSGPAANNDHVIGTLVVTFSIAAMGEVSRPLRFVNIGLGAWLIVSPLIFSGYSPIAAAASMLFGLLLIWFALPLGAIKSRYGEWDRLIRIKIGGSRQVQAAKA